jgi:ADP-ribose pyrophosphatase YjhB (NUDIX family)
VPEAQDDAQEIGIFTRRQIRFPLAFDHQRILQDYFRAKKGRRAARKGA